MTLGPTVHVQLSCWPILILCGSCLTYWTKRLLRSVMLPGDQTTGTHGTTDDAAAVGNATAFSSSSDTAAVVVFSPTNIAPVATPVTLTAGTEDVIYTINASSLLAGVSDVDGPSLSITTVSVASGGGSIVNNGNGTWSYTPAANYNAARSPSTTQLPTVR